MKKITILFFCFFLSINVFADEWPHENISNAEFALDVLIGFQLILLKNSIILWVKSTFLQISVTSKVTVLRIAGYTITKSWQMLCLMLAVQGGGFGLQKIFGLLGSENGKLKCLVRIVKCFIKKNLTT